MFQVFALVLLVIAWGGAFVLAVTGGGPMPRLVPYLGVALSGLVVWIVASLAWMIAVTPVRLFTDFPTLEEELARTGASSLGEAVRLERAKLDRAATGTAIERRRRHLLFAAVGGVMAVAFALATVAMIEVVPDHVLLVAPLGALVSFGFALVHGARAVLAHLER